MKFKGLGLPLVLLIVATVGLLSQTGQARALTCTPDNQADGFITFADATNGTCLQGTPPPRGFQIGNVLLAGGVVYGGIGGYNVGTSTCTGTGCANPAPATQAGLTTCNAAAGGGACSVSVVFAGPGLPDLTLTYEVADNSVTMTNIAVTGGAFDPATGPTAQQRPQHTQRVISNFMSRRADQITANDPDLTHRLNGGANGNGGAVNFTGEGTLDNAQMAFSTSLRQIVGAGEAARRNRAAELGKVMALGQTGLSDTIPSPHEEGFDLWVEGKWAHVDDETRESELGLLYVGLDYRFHRDLLVGVLTQFDWTDETDSLVASKADGFGWMVGPYMAARIMSQLVFDGRVVFGQSDNDVSPFGTYTDSFDGNRWLIRGQLTGQFDHAGIAIAPHVRVIYYEERQESYTDSLGVFIPGRTVSLGRLTFGPKFSGRHEMSDGTVIAPHLALIGIWDFDEAETVNVVTGLAAGSSDELRGKVEGGLAVQFADGWRLDGKGFYDGIGANELDVYGGSITCTVPLN